MLRAPKTTNPAVLVILDRDGVINYDSSRAVTTVAEWQPLPGSLQAIANLTHAGFCVAIATNQSAVAMGRLAVRTLTAIHEKLCRAVANVGGRIDAIAWCPHAPGSRCPCRKPAPGLLAQIERATGECAVGAPFIGDSLRDLDAARAHGCLPLLVRTGNGARSEQAAGAMGIKLVFDDLAAAADWIVSRPDGPVSP